VEEGKSIGKAIGDANNAKFSPSNRVWAIRERSAHRCGTRREKASWKGDARGGYRGGRNPDGSRYFGQRADQQGVDRNNIIGRLKAAQISYEPETAETIDFVEVRGDMVVIMGEEVLHPNKDAPYAGKTEYRRFTDVWKPFNGVWKLWIRQATITKVE
jgi:hypothetical protein